MPHVSTHHVNSSSTRIDVIFVYDLDKVLAYDQHEVFFLSYHDLINIKFEFDGSESQSNHQPFLIRSLKNIPESEVLEHLSSYDWTSTYLTPDMNTKVYRLTYYLNDAFDSFAPMHLSSVKNRFSPWMTVEIRTLFSLFSHKREK